MTYLLKQGISAGKLLARERKRISGCRLSPLTSDSRKYVIVRKLANFPSQYKMNLNGARTNRSNMSEDIERTLRETITHYLMTG